MGCVQAFDKQAHWQVMKEILTHMFATPRGHPRSKPFVDHVLSFSVADNRLWIRNYQVHLPNCHESGACVGRV